MSRRMLVTVVFLYLIPVSLAGQGWIEPPPRPRPGWESQVVKLRTQVQVRVEGRVALVEVEEWFRNDGGRLGEGDYLYPLPGDAVFDNFSLFQGDQELTGETLDAERARQIYEEIVRRKRDPALIEMVGQGMIRARVFPINPGETRKITLRFTQIMSRAGDALQFRYAAGRRHTGPRHVASDVAPPGGTAPSTPPLSFELTVERGDQFGDPFSPTHALHVTRSHGRIRARPEGSLQGRFTVFLPLARDRVGLTLVTHRPNEHEPGYFMLTVSPPDGEQAAVPRDLTVVLDISGSMSGHKLAQAKAALQQLLDTLDPRDRFRLIAFNNRITTFRPGWSGVRVRTDAAAWIEALRADGGTNIADALEAALEEPSNRESLPMVLFLTDGLPSVGEQDPNRIAAMATASRGDARIFAFGVGYDVNTILLDQLTVEGRGSTRYVEPGEDVEQAIAELARKIQRPVLTDLRLDPSGGIFSETYPVTMPDLFAGEELVIFGRYTPRGRETRTVAITGVRTGRSERFHVEGRFPDHQPANEFIPRLWASRKLGHLTRIVRLEGPSDRLLSEIRETALRYGLISEYTSYLVLEPEQSIASRPGAPSRSAPAEPMPLAAAGQKAVTVAEEARRLRQARAASDLDALADQRVNRTGGLPRQAVAGRQFVLRDGWWTDELHVPGRPVMDIEAFGDAYFRLLRLAPELEPWLAAFEQVVVAGAEISIRIVPSGSAGAEPGTMEALVRKFRGM